MTTGATRSRLGRRPVRDDTGTGLLPSIVGVGAFLAFLLLAAHVLVGLQARSALGAAAFDAARVVSGSDAAGRADAVERAERDARRVLGRFGDRARFEWRVAGDVVEVRATAPAPALLPVVAGGPLGGSEIERTVRVRVERLR